MSFAIKIKKCGDCQWYSNSSIEHDDPFTSTPAYLTHLCREPQRAKKV
jgi:hypothetical protein